MEVWSIRVWTKKEFFDAGYTQHQWEFYQTETQIDIAKKAEKEEKALKKAWNNLFWKKWWGKRKIWTYELFTVEYSDSQWYYYLTRLE